MVVKNLSICNRGKHEINVICYFYFCDKITSDPNSDLSFQNSLQCAIREHEACSLVSEFPNQELRAAFSTGDYGPGLVATLLRDTCFRTTMENTVNYY